MPPAARLSDLHVCPAFQGVVPHIGGPILTAGG
ncbi:MAG TPA: type VI secretion protein, partial [Myxococcota bacterium]|nr:type VI secretion protein [Myxococcota bacterium]